MYWLFINHHYILIFREIYSTVIDQVLFILQLGVLNFYIFLVCWSTSSTRFPQLNPQNTCFVVIPIFLAYNGLCYFILCFIPCINVLQTFAAFKGTFKHPNKPKWFFLFTKCAFLLLLTGPITFGYVIYNIWNYFIIPFQRLNLCCKLCFFNVTI